MRLTVKALCFGFLGVAFGCGSVSLSAGSESELNESNAHLEAEIDPCTYDTDRSGRRVFMPQGKFSYHVPRGSAGDFRKFEIEIWREDRPIYYADPTGSPTGGPPQISGYTRVNRFEIFECFDTVCDSKEPYKVVGKNKGTLIFDASSDPVKVIQIFDPAPNSQPVVRRYSMKNMRKWVWAPPENGFPGRYFFDWNSLDTNGSDLSLYAWIDEDSTPDCKVNLIGFSNCERVGEPKWCPSLHQCRQVAIWRPTKPHMNASIDSCTSKCVNKQTRNSICFRCESGYYAFELDSGEFECRVIPPRIGDQSQNVSTGQGTDRTDFASQAQCDANALSSACENVGHSTGYTCESTSSCGCECGEVVISF